MIREAIGLLRWWHWHFRGGAGSTIGSAVIARGVEPMKLPMLPCVITAVVEQRWPYQLRLYQGPLDADVFAAMH